MGKDIRKVWGAINRWAGVDQDPGCKLGASKGLTSWLKQAGLSGERKQNSRSVAKHRSSTPGSKPEAMAGGS